MIDITKTYTTSGGVETIALYHFPKRASSQRILAVFQSGDAVFLYENGKYLDGNASHQFDLIEPKPPTLDWKAVERGEQKIRHRDSKEEALEVRVFSNGYVAVTFVRDRAYVYRDPSCFELVPPPPAETIDDVRAKLAKVTKQRDDLLTAAKNAIKLGKECPSHVADICPVNITPLVKNDGTMPSIGHLRVLAKVADDIAAGDAQ